MSARLTSDTIHVSGNGQPDTECRCETSHSGMHVMSDMCITRSATIRTRTTASRRRCARRTRERRKVGREHIWREHRRRHDDGRRRWWCRVWMFRRWRWCRRITVIGWFGWITCDWTIQHIRIIWRVWCVWCVRCVWHMCCGWCPCLDTHGQHIEYSHLVDVHSCFRTQIGECSE